MCRVTSKDKISRTENEGILLKTDWACVQTLDDQGKTFPWEGKIKVLQAQWARRKERRMWTQNEVVKSDLLHCRVTENQPLIGMG